MPETGRRWSKWNRESEPEKEARSTEKVPKGERRKGNNIVKGRWESKGDWGP